MKFYKILLLSLIVILFTSCSAPDDDSDLTSASSSSSSYSDPFYDRQWAINYDSGVFELNSIEPDAHIHVGDNLSKYTGNGIKIVVIDFGLDVTHEDLVGRIENTYSLHNGSDVSDISESGRHGTATTGIIAANKNNIGIRGIAYNSKISFIKLEDFTSSSETISLFNKAEEYGADVINCSWGTVGNMSDSVRDKIIELATTGRDGKGISIVFSSGNEDGFIGNNEANINEIISVGATDKFNTRTTYSNYGDALDIVAPGGRYLGIYTTDIMGTEGYDSSNYTGTFTGTSASAPVVTGVIALMLEKNPNLTRIEIENILKSTADKIGTAPYNDNNGTSNIFYGYGKINLSAIMNAI